MAAPAEQRQASASGEEEAPVAIHQAVRDRRRGDLPRLHKGQAVKPPGKGGEHDQDGRELTGPRQRPVERGTVYVRFEMPGPGVIFQHDASRHCWLPALGGQQYLLLTQDDYSRRVIGALLVPRETSWTHILVVRYTVQTYGRPLAYYVDNHSIFRWVTHQSYRYTITTAEAGAQVQFRRVLRSLEIGIIHSRKGQPEAQGTIEKRFDYFQRRLLFLCEKYRVREFGEGNRILNDEVAYYNEVRVYLETGEIPTQRWDQALAADQGWLRPLSVDVDLPDILSLHLERTVGKDGTFPFLGQRWLLGRRLHRRRVQLRWIPEEDSGYCREAARSGICG